MEKVDKIDDDVQKLIKQFVAMSEAINTQVSEQREASNKQAYDANVMISKHDSMLSDFQLWQTTTFKDKMDHFEEFQNGYKSYTEKIDEAIEALNKHKAEKVDLKWLNDHVMAENREFVIKMDKDKDNLLTLEHYTERYLPVQVQNMIIENMQVVLDEDMIKRLKGEENKLYNRLQRQIMEMDNYGDGTIFERIEAINKEMMQKLELKIDLRNAAL